jgi:hypothetical protein
MRRLGPGLRVDAFGSGVEIAVAGASDPLPQLTFTKRDD